MKQLKAAVFDLDDTLLHDDLSVSPFTTEVFRRLSLSGFRFIAASGRTLMSMKPFTDLLGCVSLCIACNGALIWDPADGRVLSREVLSVELCHEIADFGNRYHVYAQTYSDDRFFFNEVSEYSRRYAEASMLSGEYVGDLKSFIREERSKILMMAEPEKISEMLAAGRKLFFGRASVTCSKPHFLEFNPLTATKGIALSKAASLLGLSPEDFVAFGDSLNDVPMMEIAGHSVAVSNARPEIRSLCNEVCLSNQQDGVANWLNSNIIV